MTTMAPSAQDYADQFAALNSNVMEIVRACANDDWAAPCQDEGWPVGVVAHHIATIYPDFSGLLEAFLRDETRSPSSSMADVDLANAQHAHDYLAVGQATTLEALSSGGAALTSAILRLGNERLAAPAGVFGDRALTVAQVVEWVVIGHTQLHYESIVATLA